MPDPSSEHFAEYTPWQNTLQERSFGSMSIRDTLSRNLKAARRQKGFSQEDLAEKAGLDRTYISSLERCVYSATIDVVERLAFALDTRVIDLLGGEDRK